VGLDLLTRYILGILGRIPGPYITESRNRLRAVLDIEILNNYK
jgi:hypothetical protein